MAEPRTERTVTMHVYERSRPAAGMVRRVSGSNPEEGSAKTPQTGVFVRIDLHAIESGAGMKPFMEASGRERPDGKPRRRTAERFDDFGDTHGEHGRALTPSVWAVRATNCYS